LAGRSPTSAGNDSLPVLETEYVLALRSKDKRHQVASQILDKAKQGRIDNLVIAGSSILELAFGLRGKLGRVKVIETLEIIRAISNDIPVLDLDLEAIIKGLSIEIDLDRLNPYDCLHAAVALSHDGVIVSSDPFFDTIEGIRRLDFGELLV
jgi:predicted nucleic acid-binding protein